MTIGIVATGALSLGVIITAVSGGFNVDVSDYMFGSILAMSNCGCAHESCVVRHYYCNVCFVL